MKKFISFFVALVMAFTMANAQAVESSKFFENTYVTVTGGAITTTHTGGQAFFWGGAKNIVKGVRPFAGVEFGKYVTPVVGFSIEGLVMFKTTGSNTFVDQSNVIGNLKFNLSNWFSGYPGQPRRVEVVFVPGLGWGHDYGNVVYDRNYLTYNLGAELNVNLGKDRAWQVNVKPVVMWNNYGTPAGNVLTPTLSHMQARLQVGLTYKFGSRSKKSHNFVLCPYPVTTTDCQVTRPRIKALENPGSVIKEAVKEVVKEVVVEKIVYTEVYSPNVYITFASDSYTLDKAEYARLAAFASELPNEVPVYLLGSADTKYGERSYNEQLALKRANTVKNTLVKDFGVDESRIVVATTLDATDNIATSRAVILSLSDVDYE